MVGLWHLQHIHGKYSKNHESGKIFYCFWQWLLETLYASTASEV